MENFEVKVKWENIVSSYIPQGWTHSKKETEYIEKSKKFEKFVDAMNYIRNVESKNYAIEITYINHKTSEIIKY